MPTNKLVRVSSKGQIVLPKRLRDKMGIHEGDYLAVGELGDGTIVIGKSTGAVFDAILQPLRVEAAAKGYTPDDVIEWVKEIRAEQRTDKPNAA